MTYLTYKIAESIIKEVKKKVVFVTKKKKKYFINLIFHNPYDNTMTYLLSLSNSNISPSLGEERIKGLRLDVSEIECNM